MALSGARDDSTHRSVAACAAAMSVAPPASPTLFSQRLSARTAGRFLALARGGAALRVKDRLAARGASDAAAAVLR